MKTQHSSFHEKELLHELKHFLPAQAPLKGFIQHNSLHAFQHLKFYDATRHVSQIFGHKVSLSLREYRDLYKKNRISSIILEKVIARRKGAQYIPAWSEKMISRPYNTSISPRIGSIRAGWKKEYYFDMDQLIHPLLFNILGEYLHHGSGDNRFPLSETGFLASFREADRNKAILKTARARQFLSEPRLRMTDLLELLVCDEALYSQYIFDQQFAHQEWSGLVSTAETKQAHSGQKKISLRDLIMVELLLETDALDQKFGPHWTPIGNRPDIRPVHISEEVVSNDLTEVISLWQDALEWTYYDEVLGGIDDDTLGFSATSNGTNSQGIGKTEFSSADNSLCVVGRSSLSGNLFLNHGAFVNSYDWEIDPDGRYLPDILKAAVPVYGGINLKQYFSGIDHRKQTVTSRNNQMEVQKPEAPASVRMLFLVEHQPEVVLKAIRKSAEIYEWFIYEWTNLVVIHPDTRKLYFFKEGKFELYRPVKQDIEAVRDLFSIFEAQEQNLDVSLIN